MTRRVDPGRLLRALALEVETLGPDTYRVTGGRERHTVTTDNVPWRCDCPDGAYRPSIRCKHVVAVQFATPVRRDPFEERFVSSGQAEGQ